MARDLGTKYNCFKCGTKFYDLKKPVPSCPKCGADQREAPVVKPISARARAAAEKAREVPDDVELPAAGDDEETDDEAEDEEEDDAE